MSQALRRRFCSGTYVFVFLLASMAAFWGCGESTERTEPGLAETSAELPRTAGADLSWPEVVGATEYRVQAWSEFRLLFSERTSHARLESSPSLERTLAFFPDAVLRVQARAADGQALGEQIEITVDSARSAVP